MATKFDFEEEAEEIEYIPKEIESIPMRMYPEDIKERIKTQLIFDKRCNHILVKDMALIFTIIDEVMK